jgi:hypothetical protein
MTMVEEEDEEKKQQRLEALSVKKLPSKKLNQTHASVSCFVQRGGGTPIEVRKEEVRLKDRPTRVGATTVVRSRHSK